MKKRFVSIAVLALLAALLLTGCSKPTFTVSTEEDNTISVTAKRAPDRSAGIGYITVGENEQVVVDADFTGSGKLQVRMMAGLLGSEDFPDEPSYDSTVSGSDSMSFTVDPGEYTVGLICQGKLTGSAVVRTEAAAK